MNTDEHGWKTGRKSVFICVHLWLIIFVFFFASCSQLETPKTEPFYAGTVPPQRKEFRWSNGKIPKSFDPARAAAAPETDIVRAIYEGLTDTDPKSLQTVPAIAAEWKSSEDFKTWTFVLRKDARWSNGARVTAQDFVRSWKRLATLGEKVSHRELVRNIVGLPAAEISLTIPEETEDAALFSPEHSNQNKPLINYPANSNSSAVAPSPSVAATPTFQPSPAPGNPIESPFGVTAVNDFTLQVALINADRDFPALVAHPIFRPIYGDGKNFETDKLNADIVTNGAFRVSSVGLEDGITLDRAENYWNRQAIELERVRFVPTENGEKALAAYRSGDVDAVTNADFEPLALKLLTPYEDFRRTAHGALNFYEFNRALPPFGDRRVREALAIAVERERLTADEMDGASLPALSFSPFERPGKTPLVENAKRARELLAESGFPNGANFPMIKLLVNRNNVQQRIARNVAKMWKRNLNVETEVVVKDSREIAAAWSTDEFAMLRRGAVLPTTNETINMMAIFEHRAAPPNVPAAENSQPLISDSQAGGNPNADSSVSTPVPPADSGNAAPSPTTGENAASAANETGETILTEDRAISELPAIPLYFPTSYSLVKPYIQGFDINLLDAPSLKTVRIDNSWQPKKASDES